MLSFVRVTTATLASQVRVFVMLLLLISGNWTYIVAMSSSDHNKLHQNRLTGSKFNGATQSMGSRKACFFHLREGNKVKSYQHACFYCGLLLFTLFLVDVRCNRYLFIRRHIVLSFEESVLSPVSLAEVRAKLVIDRPFVFYWSWMNKGKCPVCLCQWSVYVLPLGWWSFRLVRFIVSQCQDMRLVSAVSEVACGKQ
jgi:hypothetical protein